MSWFGGRDVEDVIESIRKQQRLEAEKRKKREEEEELKIETQKMLAKAKAGLLPTPPQDDPLVRLLAEAKEKEKRDRETKKWFSEVNDRLREAEKKSVNPFSNRFKPFGK